MNNVQTEKNNKLLYKMHLLASIPAENGIMYGTRMDGILGNLGWAIEKPDNDQYSFYRRIAEETLNEMDENGVDKKILFFYKILLHRIDKKIIRGKIPGFENYLNKNIDPDISKFIN